MASPIVLSDFATQNWVIAPLATPFGESPPANIHRQLWQLVLSGVVIANIEGISTSDWLHETVTFQPDVQAPLKWAIHASNIEHPPPEPPNNLVTRPFLRPVGRYSPHWTPFTIRVSRSMRATPWTIALSDYGTGTDVLDHQPNNFIFAGMDVNLAVRDKDAGSFGSGTTSRWWAGSCFWRATFSTAAPEARISRGFGNRWRTGCKQRLKLLAAA